MSKKKNKSPPKWANTGKNEKFVALYIGMLISDAYMSLTHRQQRLYTYMRLQYKGEQNVFEFNWHKANTQYKLYTKRADFYNDIATLINRGFIVCTECGEATRTASKYAFSDNWKMYPNITLTAKDKTASMLRKEKKAITKQ